jgi:outer membrane protein assembly factor BamB
MTATTGSLVVVVQTHPALATVLDAREGSVLGQTVLCEDCVVEQVVAYGDWAAVVTSSPPAAESVLRLVALSPEPPREVWSARMGWMAQVALDGSQVVAVSAQVPAPTTTPAGGPPGSPSAEVVAYDIATGAEQWRSELAVGLDRVTLGRHVYVAGLAETTAFERRSGTAQWHGSGGYAVHASDDVVLVVAHDAGNLGRTHLSALASTTGERVWDEVIPGGPRDVAIGAGLALVTLEN